LRGINAENMREKVPFWRCNSFSTAKFSYNKGNRRRRINMTEHKIEKNLKNAKISMEIEGFIIDRELEETGRKILKGEIKIRDYIEQVKREAMRYAHEV